MKKAKQFLSVFVAVLMVLSIAPISGIANIDLGSAISVNASAADYNGLVYEISDEKVTITGYDGDSISAEVVIPGTIEGYPVTAIGEQAFFDYEGITSLVIPDSISTIGESAFEDCVNLKTVTLGKGVETIDEYAFDGCTALEGIVIPDSVTTIGLSAFEECENLKAVTLGNSIETLGIYAFTRCYALESIVIPDCVKTIDKGAFFECENLKNVTFGKGVENIGDYAFDSCALESLTLPAGIKTIDDDAFASCEKIESLVIPASVTSIGEEAFVECSSLVSITVDSANTVYDSRNNCNAIIETATNTLISGCKNTVIPDGITAIAANAFDGCTDLESIDIPDSVVSIDQYAFFNCEKLKAVTLPDGLTTLGASVFDRCSSLESIVIPEGIKTIDVYAFSECDSLTKVTLPEGLETISERAFSDCSNLTEVNFPSTLKIIDSGAFRSCSKLAAAEFGDNLEKIGNVAFFGCDSLKSLVIPASVTSLHSYAFEGCSGLESIVVDSANTVYDSRDNCNAIIYTSSNNLYTGCKNTVIPEGVESISGAAFTYCEGLKSINIPASVYSISEEAFNYCSGLESITVDEGSKAYYSGGGNALISKSSNTLILGCKNTVIPNTVKIIRNGAFRYCDIESINIPDSVGQIYTEAFYGCEKLKSVTIGSGLYNLEIDAFGKCPALESITVSGNNKYYDSRDNCNAIIKTSTNRLISGCKTTVIPDTVRYIGQQAFWRCSTLTSIEIPDSVGGIEAYAFCGTGLTSVEIPANVRSLSSDCFGDCTSLESVTIGDGLEYIYDYTFNGCDNLKNVYYHCTKTNLDTIYLNSEDNPEIISDVSKWIKVHDYAEESSVAATCLIPASVTYVCSGCGDTYKETGSIGDHTPAAAVKENVVDATCTKEGSYDSVVYCSVCNAELSRETIKVEALGHTDADGNGICDRCGTNIGGDSGESSTTCSHICHSSSKFLQFFWKIGRFFCKIFRTNQYCSCGVAHY